MSRLSGHLASWNFIAGTLLTATKQNVHGNRGTTLMAMTEHIIWPQATSKQWRALFDLNIFVIFYRDRHLHTRTFAVSLSMPFANAQWTSLREVSFQAPTWRGTGYCRLSGERHKPLTRKWDTTGEIGFQYLHLLLSFDFRRLQKYLFCILSI